MTLNLYLIKYSKFFRYIHAQGLKSDILRSIEKCIIMFYYTYIDVSENLKKNTYI